MKGKKKVALVIDDMIAYEENIKESYIKKSMEFNKIIGYKFIIQNGICVNTFPALTNSFLYFGILRPGCCVWGNTL